METVALGDNVADCHFRVNHAVSAMGRSTFQNGPPTPVVYPARCSVQFLPSQ